MRSQAMHLGKNSMPTPWPSKHAPEPCTLTRRLEFGTSAEQTRRSDRAKSRDRSMLLLKSDRMTVLSFHSKAIKSNPMTGPFSHLKVIELHPMTEKAMSFKNSVQSSERCFLEEPNDRDNIDTL
ncbi:hypothetical protein B296_00046433 [Ensete ventricosum]|uniref:Uncharacterized protein n=1 Tax=Ensete ventricosum TaxID=4639 RepID=A0A426YS91_ENSVE|nr:hypothetical protein B296_00046433 [Ensete ventricosum]